MEQFASVSQMLGDERLRLGDGRFVIGLFIIPPAPETHGEMLPP